MKISIIVPTYNVEKYIVECVKSVCEQTYKNLEVIIIDNDSKDNTYKILQKMQKQYNFMLDTAENIWPYCWDECRNKGMAAMTGEWFTVMCSDDYLNPDYISKAVEHIKNNPSTLAFQSPIKGVRNNKSEVGIVAHEYSSVEQFKHICLSKSPVNTPTVFYHRSLYEKGLVFGKPDLYSGAADYNLYCELADTGIFIQPLSNWIGYYYRWHEEQATWGMHRSPIKYDKLIQDHWRAKWKQD